jgi:hypothetical protein
MSSQLVAYLYIGQFGSHRRIKTCDACVNSAKFGPLIKTQLTWLLIHIDARWLISQVLHRVLHVPHTVQLHMTYLFGLTIASLILTRN